MSLPNLSFSVFSIIHTIKHTFYSILVRVVLCLSFTSISSRIAFMDASRPWQLGFQDPATPIMEGIIFFNGFLMAFMLFIACLVGWLLYKCLTLYDESVHSTPVGFTHSTLLEVVWTIVPAAILVIISIPSYNLLYAMDEVIDPSITVKIVGHQWYWSYECSDFDSLPSADEASFSKEASSAEMLSSNRVELPAFSDEAITHTLPRTGGCVPSLERSHRN